MHRALSRVPSLLVATSLFLSLAGPTTAQVGFTVSSEAAIARLYRLNLETADLVEVANLGSSLAFAALDRGPEGLIYGLTWSDELYTLDPDTGATEMIGELENEDLRGLAFGPGGGLWVAGNQILERIDPATAATLESLTMDQNVKTLAATGDRLFGISEPNRRLWAIDTGSGELTLITDLPGMQVDWIDADFDELGTLWIAGHGSGPIMGTITTGLYSVPDPPSGEVIEHHLWLFILGEDNPWAYFNGLVMVERTLSVVDVPALGGAGAALLAALLAALGASAVRRSGRDRNRCR